MESEPASDIPTNHPTKNTNPPPTHPISHLLWMGKCFSSSRPRFMAEPLLILHKVPEADAMMPHAAQLKVFGKRFKIKIIIRGLHSRPENCVSFWPSGAEGYRYEMEFMQTAVDAAQRPPASRARAPGTQLMAGFIDFPFDFTHSFLWFACESKCSRAQLESRSVMVDCAIGSVLFALLVHHYPYLKEYIRFGIHILRAHPHPPSPRVFCALGHSEPRDSHYLQFWVFTRSS